MLPDISLFLPPPGTNNPFFAWRLHEGREITVWEILSTSSSSQPVAEEERIRNHRLAVDSLLDNYYLGIDFR
jgi:hypothetical protein